MRRLASSAQVLNVLSEGVGLGTNDDLNGRALLDNAKGAGGFKRRLVNEVGIVHLDAQSGDARLKIVDVVVAAEGCQDLLCLAHGVSLL